MLVLGTTAFAPLAGPAPAPGSRTAPDQATVQRQQLPLISQQKLDDLGAQWTTTFLDIADGERLHTSILTPVGTDLGEGSQAHLPVIAVVSPYLGNEGALDEYGPTDRFLDLFEGTDLFRQGYAVVQVSTRGTGGSSGCLDILGPGDRAGPLPRLLCGHHAAGAVAAVPQRHLRLVRRGRVQHGGGPGVQPQLGDAVWRLPGPSGRALPAAGGVPAGYLDTATNIGAGALQFFENLSGDDHHLRAGFFDAVMGFYDEHLKGIEGADDEVAVAAQTSTGQWREEDSSRSGLRAVTTVCGRSPSRWRRTSTWPASRPST